MRRITIEETRKSLVEQIIVKLRLCDTYEFEDDVPATLVTGQQIPCTIVELKSDDTIVFTLNLVGVQFIEVGAADLTLETLDNICRSIKEQEHTMDIWAADCDENGENHTILFCKNISSIPTSKSEAIDALKEIIPCEWQEASNDFGEGRYVYYPEPLDKDRYLIAHFD